MKSTFGRIALCGLLLGLCGATANAHTIALGTTNAGGPGSVTLWLGTYDHGGFETAEGTMTLTAGPGIPPTQPQTFVGTGTVFPGTNVLPDPTLVGGVNLHYASGSCCGGPAGVYTSATNANANGLATFAWQRLTFNGLSAGTYTYSLTGMSTVIWRDWSSDTNNWTGQFTVTQAVASGNVPEPGTMAIWSVLGLGAAFVGYRRRKAKSA